MKNIVLVILLIAVALGYGWITKGELLEATKFTFEKGWIISERLINNIGENVGDFGKSVKENVSGVFGGQSSLDTLCLGEQSDDVCFSFARGDFGTGSNSTSTAIWRNVHAGKEVFIDQVEIVPSVKASSTMEVWVATSTRATTTIADYTNPEPGGSQAIVGSNFPVGNIGLERFVLASSTIATGTRPIVISGFNVGQYLARSVGASATTSIVLADGELLVFGIRSPSKRCAGSEGPSATERACESATSTNRGDFNWMVRYHYYR